MIFVDYHVQCALLTLIMHTARDSQQKSPSTSIHFTTTTIQQPFIRKAHLILGASKCTLGALHPLDAPPQAESFFCDQSRYFAISNGIFKFNFLALVDSEIMGFPNLH